MNSLKTINRQDLKGKRVLVRVDFNLPIEDRTVRDVSRIKNTISTIRFLQKAGSKIILISHLGKTSAFSPDQSLKIIVDEISKEYGSKIVFIDDCLLEEANKIIAGTSTNEIILLENLRFYMEEEACDMDFAKKLAGLADFYINEAFSVSHRKHASIFAIPQFLPHALGISFQKEIQIIDEFFKDASRPKMCILGGSKLSTKVKLLKNLSKKVNKLALGGGIAGAFLAFWGNKTLKIFNSKEYESDIDEIVENARKHNCELIMPVDFSALINDQETFKHVIISSEDNSASVFDIGPASVELFKKHIRESKTILWNGPVGLFEKAPFNFGTMSIAQEIAKLTKERQLVSIIGGGDTSFAIKQFGVSQDMSHVSTAGGAFMSYIEGSPLPGIEAMK